MSGVRPVRKPGRKCGDGIGFPVGCAGEKPDALALCTAMQRGRQCLACTRVADFPMPAEWQGNATRVMGGPSVQAVWSKREGKWFVLVLIAGTFMVDGRFPIVACSSQDEATEIAHVRARQIEPYAPLVRRGDGDWRCGRVVVWVLSHGR